jgi:hypothetical protein
MGAFNPWAEPEPECIKEGEYKVEVSWISDHYGTATFPGTSEDDVRKYVENEAIPFDFHENGGCPDRGSMQIEKVICIKEPVYEGQEEQQSVKVGLNQLALEL